MTTVYDEIEDKVVALLKTLTDYFSVDADGEYPITQGDFRVVDKGFEYMLVVRPGVFDETHLGVMASVDWKVDMALIVLNIGDGSEWAKLNAARSAICELFVKYPTLDGLSDTSYGVYQVTISGGKPFFYPPEQGWKGKWLIQDMTLSARRLSVPIGGEYPG